MKIYIFAGPYACNVQRTGLYKESTFVIAGFSLSCFTKYKCHNKPIFMEKFWYYYVLCIKLKTENIPPLLQIFTAIVFLI